MADETYFKGERWTQLAGFLEQLPRPVRLVVWADERGSNYEREGLRLAEALAGRFEILQFEHRPRVEGHYFYPVFGFMGLDDAGKEEDFRLRFIGLPAGYQINSLVGAIQAVSFRASNLEGLTRIHLSRLPAGAQVDLELFTSAENEAGAIVATLAAGFAVASPRVHTFIAMADLFPEVARRYSVRNLPHLVLNGRVHYEGILDEEKLLKQVAIAVK